MERVMATADIRAMSAYCELQESGGRVGPELKEKYGVGDNRIRQLAMKGWRLCNPLHHWTYGILTDEELKDLAYISDWPKFLTEELNDNTTN
jgi:hypothetical protein